jgi:hypothetical protein
MDQLSGRAVTSPATWVRGRRSRSASLLAVLAALVTATSASAGTWGTAVHFTRDGLGSLETNHTLAVSGSTLHAIYSRNQETLAYRRSFDTGRTWGAEVVLQPPEPSTTVGYEGLAVATTDRSRVLVLYRADSLSGVDPRFHALYLLRSETGGNTWLPRIKLASSTTSDARWSDADLGVLGLRALVAWTDSTSGRILTRRSDDGGATWKPIVNIAYVAWIQGTGNHYRGLMLRRSSDGGATFSPRQTVNAGDLAGAPSLSARSQTMLLLYGLPNGTIRLARSTNGGAALTQSSVAGATTGRYPGDVHVNGTKAGLAYRKGGKIWTRRSTDNGATWGLPDLAYNGQPVYTVNVVVNPAVTVIEFEPAASPFETNVWARRGS